MVGEKEEDGECGDGWGVGGGEERGRGVGWGGMVR